VATCKVRVWWATGRDGHDDGLPVAHVLPLDLCLVLRWQTRVAEFFGRHKAFPSADVGTRP
jgi:hypothetical protein